VSSWPWLCLLFCSPKMTEKNFTNTSLAWSSHVKSIGFKWPAWISGTFRGVRYFLTIVGLPTGRKPLFNLQKCCKAQLKWTANINIVLDWNESLHTIGWSNISSGSLAVPHVPRARAPKQTSEVGFRGSKGLWRTINHLQLSCLLLTFPAPIVQMLNSHGLNCRAGWQAWCKLNICKWQ